LLGSHQPSGFLALTFQPRCLCPGRSLTRGILPLSFQLGCGLAGGRLALGFHTCGLGSGLASSFLTLCLQLGRCCLTGSRLALHFQLSSGLPFGGSTLCFEPRGLSAGRSLSNRFLMLGL
jgi:hypothetical protein